VVQLQAGEIKSTDRERRLFFKITRIAYSNFSKEIMLTIDEFFRQQPPAISHFMVLVPNDEMDILTNNVQGQIFDRLVKRK